MRYVAVFVIYFLFPYVPTARADFMVSSAILEFTADGPKEKDIELLSKSAENDYIATEIDEVLNPDQPTESRRVIEDADAGGLLVTPDKTILAAGSSRVLRFVLTRNLDAQEHIYRVAVKPVIKGVDNKTKIGLKVLIGYEILVIVRPTAMTSDYTASRQGKIFTATNKGNTNILFENGQQCKQDGKCPMPPVMRIYPGQTKSITLPLDSAIDYSIWNGQDIAMVHYN